MGKTSTNAGIDHYRKPDFKSPLKLPEKKGLPLAINPKFMDVVISTEYKDSKNKELYFKDEVELDGENYVINYDPRNFKWILVKNQTIVVLREVTKRVVLTKKCSARNRV